MNNMSIREMLLAKKRQEEFDRINAEQQGMDAVMGRSQGIEATPEDFMNTAVPSPEPVVVPQQPQHPSTMLNLPPATPQAQPPVPQQSPISQPPSLMEKIKAARAQRESAKEERYNLMRDAYMAMGYDPQQAELRVKVQKEADKRNKMVDLGEAISGWGSVFSGQPLNTGYFQNVRDENAALGDQMDKNIIGDYGADGDDNGVQGRFVAHREDTHRNRAMALEKETYDIVRKSDPYTRLGILMTNVDKIKNLEREIESNPVKDEASAANYIKQIVALYTTMQDLDKSVVREGEIANIQKGQSLAESIKTWIGRQDGNWAVISQKIGDAMTKLVKQSLGSAQRRYSELAKAAGDRFNLYKKDKGYAPVAKYLDIRRAIPAEYAGTLSGLASRYGIEDPTFGTTENQNGKVEAVNADEVDDI